MELEPGAAELYGLPPDQFIAARNERADAAKSAGDQALAAAVRKLKKPTVAAYATNLLTRQRQEDVEALVDLGEQMRAASAARDGAALRALSQQRHHLVVALVSAAADLASNAGQPVSETAQRDVETSLQAAVSDAACARELMTGELSGPLRTDGLAAFGPLGTAAPKRQNTGAEDDSSHTGTRELREAEDALQHAADAATEADENTTAARDAHDVAEQALSAATADLAALRTKLEAAERDRTKREQSVASATATLKEAEAASERARVAEVAASNRVRALRTTKPTRSGTS